MFENDKGGMKYSAAIQSASRVVEQWLQHDKYREIAGESALYDEGVDVPTDVNISMALLAATETINKLEDALLKIVRGRLLDGISWPNENYKHGYMDGQEEQKRVARKVLGHGS